MKRRVTTLPPQATAEQAARVMKETGCGLIPVCDADQAVLGVITDRDIVVRVCAEGLSPSITHLSTIMTRQVVACAPSDPLALAEELMTRNHVHRVLVLQSGILVGVISLTEVAHSEEPIRAARVMRDLTSWELRIE